MAKLSLRNVQKTYAGGTQVVHGIDMEIADGEFIVIVGPSGCGKSTLLRMVAGLETITGGEVHIGEKVVNGKNDHDDILVGGSGRYRAIRLKVTDARMKMHDVVVEFSDGSKFSPDTQVTFDEGQRTGVIDLPGGARKIRRVGLRYSDLRGGGFAHVEVWAR